MPIVFTVKKSQPVWQSIFDDTKLQNKQQFTWSGSTWESNPQSLGNVVELEVKTGETWNDGFRPTKVRFTWNTTGGEVGEGSWEITGKDEGGNTIFSDPANATILAELDITWGSDDFDYVQFLYWGAGPPSELSISNIEWYDYL
jgi:hypothetical protein